MNIETMRLLVEKGLSAPGDACNTPQEPDQNRLATGGD